MAESDVLIQTAMAPDEVLARLKAAAAQDQRVRYREQGASGFTLRKVGGRNSMRPTMRAALNLTERGTSIRASAPQPVWAVWFARFWWLASVGLALAFLAVAVATRTLDPGLLVPGLMLPVMGGAIFGAAVNAGKAEARFLQEWLDEQLAPVPPESVAQAEAAARLHAATKQHT